MSKSAKIERQQKEFLKALKKTFSEDPNPETPIGQNYHPTILVGGDHK